MFRSLRKYSVQYILVVTVMVFAVPSLVLADRFQSTNYTIDAGVVGNSAGGDQTSTNYRLTSSAGESIIGNATGGSYILGQGYTAQLEDSIQLSVTPSPLNLGSVSAGTPITGTLTAEVTTSSPAYSLGVSQDVDMTKGGDTIPAISGTIASPLTWVDGATKGLGFTLVSTNATAIPGKWSSGNAYARFPASSTTFYNRTGFTGGTTDSHVFRVKLDVDILQAPGAYSNTVTWTGTTVP